MKKKNIIAVLVAVVVIIAAVLLVSRYLKARTPILPSRHDGMYDL